MFLWMESFPCPVFQLVRTASRRVLACSDVLGLGDMGMPPCGGCCCPGATAETRGPLTLVLLAE